MFRWPGVPLRSGSQSRKLPLIEPGPELFGAAEPAEPQPYLKGVDTGIESRKARVGDMQIAGFNGPCILFSQNVDPDCGGWREIHSSSSGGNIVVGK